MLTITAALVLSSGIAPKGIEVEVLTSIRTETRAHRLGNTVRETLSVKSGKRTLTLILSPVHTAFGKTHEFKAGEKITVPSLPKADTWTLRIDEIKLG